MATPRSAIHSALVGLGVAALAMNAWAAPKHDIPFGLKAPSGFEANEKLLGMDGPLEFTNFHGDWIHSGLLPQGGAAINIWQDKTNKNNYSLDRELNDGGIQIDAKSTVTLSQATCEMADYTDTSRNPSMPEIRKVVYCVKGPFVYRLGLEYYADDPKAAQYQAAFQKLLDTAVLP